MQASNSTGVQNTDEQTRLHSPSDRQSLLTVTLRDAPCSEAPVKGKQIFASNGNCVTADGNDNLLLSSS